MKEKIESKLREKFPQAILEVNDFRGDLTFLVDKNSIVEICKFLKEDDELAFDLLVDLCGVDRAKRKDRFEVVYHITSLKNKYRIRLKVRVDEKDCVVDSVTSVYPTANWHERETYDMFGITFRNHPDLRRMYMPEEFEYHPLRKDFPLLGIPGSLSLPKK
ncbi:MAG: NADH-quinone oxidoreductase subunit C [Ignavibacteria bacterium]|jgi:NADH-quinone oxidoreductase subunit C|nr:NADH-quinone oxidoreductase subunit C [Ignavibacteria bacterium]MDH7526986.1 NADH-quinone oxidoreductase subunit C [Ignavibacteria bacterium]NPV10869.1 NADH-quinone oxidoreductase subunit C [Ignavibacteria bacterium]